MLGASTISSKSVYVGFQNRAAFEYQGKIAQFDLRDEHAAAGDYGHELIALQTMESLANWRPPNTGARLQVLFVDDGAGREF